MVAWRKELWYGWGISLIGLLLTDCRKVGCLQMTETYCLPVLEARMLNPGVGKPLLPQKKLGKDLFQTCALVSVSIWCHLSC